MKWIPLAAVIGTAACLLASCSTQPVATSEAREVKPTHWGQPRAGAAVFIVKRDSGLMGGACAVGVYVDGQEVASLWPSQKVILHLDPGRRMVGARNGTICGRGIAEAAVDLSGPGPTTYRVEILDGGGIRIQPTAF